MVDCHGEKITKHGSHDDKNTLYFGGLGQITDTITRFWSMNKMFWVNNYILQTCNKVLANSCDIWTHSLENVKTVSKNVPKQLRKTVQKFGRYCMCVTRLNCWLSWFEWSPGARNQQNNF